MFLEVEKGFRLSKPSIEYRGGFKMKLIGYRGSIAVGDEAARVIVALSWEEVQCLLNAGVMQADHLRRQGQRQGAQHLIDSANFTLSTANTLEQAWFDRAK